MFYVNVCRGGPGLGNISPAQSDYFQSTRGGGHGDYRVICFGPANVQELYDYTMLGFDLADKYRNPAMILADGILGQMMEPLVLREYKPIPNLPSKASWRLGDPATKDPILITSLILNSSLMEKLNYSLQAKYDRIMKDEVRYEEVDCGGADIILVAYGTASRICRSVMATARAQGMKVGLFRPITIWPYPYERIGQLAERTKNFLVVEMSLGQMWEDARLGVEGRARVHLHGRTAGGIPDEGEILAQMRKILDSKGKEIFRNF
jgi:2-oxoglutarate ferredoxin oxidoreductase subunit alpha